MAKKQKEEDKSVKLFLGAIIILIVILAAIISIKYFYQPKEKINAYSYNNFLFTNVSGLWITEIQKAGTNTVYRVPLHFGPKELEDITIDGGVNAFKNYSQIYITFNPDEEMLSFIALSASELSLNLAQTLNITPVAACTKNGTDACINRTIVNCQSAGQPAIFLNYANQTAVYVKNNCIFVEGMGRDLVRATDRLLLKWFSIMN